MPPAPLRVDAVPPDDRPDPTLAPPDADPVPQFDDVLSRVAVQAFVARSQRRGSAAAFQALLAAAEAAVRGVLPPLREAAASALNLAQQQTLDAALAHLDTGATALHDGLSAEGLAAAADPPSGFRQRFSEGWLDRLRARASELTHPASVARPTWVAATAAAVDALGGAADHLTTLAAAQPDDSSARALGLGVARQLQQHRDMLLAEVARLVE